MGKAALTLLNVTKNFPHVKDIHFDGKIRIIAEQLFNTAAHLELFT